MWAARLADDRLIGAAWEWVEVLPGVPAIRDPNGIVSNLRLVDGEGQELEELQCIVGLNRIAHAMPWQQAVVGMARGEAQRGLERRKRAARRGRTGLVEGPAPVLSEAERLRDLLAMLPRRSGVGERVAALAT